MKLKGAFIVCAMVAALLAGPASDAWASAYKYRDAEGALHLTNDRDAIPEQFRESAEEMEEQTHTDGFTPSYEQIVAEREQGVVANRAEATWYKYQNIGWFDRMRLLTRAGLADSKGMAKAMKGQLVTAGLLMVALLVFVFKAIRGGANRSMVLTLMFVCVGIVLFSIFIQKVKERRDDVLNKVRSMQSMNQERMQDLEAVLNEGQVPSPYNALKGINMGGAVPPASE
jgi:hypothetical protein